MSLDFAIKNSNWMVVPALIRAKAKIYDYNYVADAIAMNDESLIDLFVSSYPEYGSCLHYGLAKRGDLHLFNRIYRVTDQKYSRAIDGFVDGDNTRVLTAIVEKSSDPEKRKKMICMITDRALRKEKVNILSLFVFERSPDEWKELADEAAEYGYTKSLDYILSVFPKDMFNYDELTLTAATNDHLQIVEMMVDKYEVTCINQIAETAADHNNEGIVMKMLDRGADSYQRIAEKGASVGNIHIVEACSKRGTIDYIAISNIALDNGHEKEASLIREMDFDTLGDHLRFTTNALSI